MTPVAKRVKVVGLPISTSSLPFGTPFSAGSMFQVVATERDETARVFTCLAMFGAFRPSQVAYSGLLWSVQLSSSATQAEIYQENPMEAVADAQSQC
jgi:hypothetical protein